MALCKSKSGKSKSCKSESGNQAINTISMTGFAHADLRCEGVTINVEIKALNNRFQDLNLRLPREFASAEAQVRERLAGLTGRGRLDVMVTRENTSQNGIPPLDHFRIAEIYRSYELLAKKLKISLDPTQTMLAAIKRSESGSTEGASNPSQKEVQSLLKCIDKAIAELSAARGREGKQLGVDLVKRIKILKHKHIELDRLAQTIRETMADRFASRLARIAPEVTVDPARFAAEVVVLIDRLDVNEELVRLSSHFAGFEEAMCHSPNGRKLDFLVQEIGREFNTIGSKAQDAQMQAIVVDAKTELERIREQVQNLQ